MGGGTLLTDLFEPKHLWFVIATLFIVIVALGAGKGLGVLISLLLKKLGKGTVTVNVGATDRERMSDDRIAMAGDRVAMASDRAVLSGHACLIPDNCPKHGEENQRSLQNKNDIAKLEAQHHEDREFFVKELRSIRRGITCITNGLLAKQIIDPRDMPRED